MSKRLYWLIGLVLVLALGSILYWQVEWPHEQKSALRQSAGHVGQEDCAKAQFPFACYLDKAMTADNPDLCSDVGREKRVNCLQAYTEIKNEVVDCNKLSDQEFKIECQMAFKANQESDQTQLPTTTDKTLLSASTTRKK